LLADIAVRTFHLPLPASLTGMLLLLVCILLGVVKASGSVPGPLAAGGDAALLRPRRGGRGQLSGAAAAGGWRIMVVLIVSTMLVLGTTALVVDRVYRLELKLARRSRRHV
jgi:holin-like protein